MSWWWFRIREWFRWVFRGQDFTKVEAHIHKLAAPLASERMVEKYRVKHMRRIKRAISYLPPHLQERHHDMMDRLGYSVRR